MCVCVCVCVCVTFLNHQLFVTIATSVIMETQSMLPATEVQSVYSTAPADWATFPRDISIKWNKNSFIQDLNLDH